MTKEKRRSLHNYLASYRYYFPESSAGHKETSVNAELRAQAFSVYRSVMDMPPSKEKLLLYYHYLRFETLESCAELLGISRRSVFRLKNSALELYSSYAEKDLALKYLS